MTFDAWLTTNHTKLYSQFYKYSCHMYLTFSEFVDLEYLHYTQPSRTYR
jgi:hypothetical protein